jgi:hypothetical protein
MAHIPEHIENKVLEIKENQLKGLVLVEESRAKRENREPEVMELPVFNIIEEARFVRLAERALNGENIN